MDSEHPSPSPVTSPASTWLDSEFVRAAAIVFLSLALLVGCYNSGFTTYDDSMHVSRNEQITQLNPLQLFKPIPLSTYFPVTLITYQLDRTIFHEWLGWQNWAPGVRAMSWLYHVLAAIFLWRFLLRFGIPRNAAFFTTLVFAVHPLATETVCWTSERKNALAAMFGFASLWAWTATAARWWRMPLVSLLFAAALMSKPSALGLVPVFLFLDVFFGQEGRLATSAPLRTRWPGILLRMLPIGVLAGIALKLNLAGHAPTIVEPPGGSIFTAILTDLEIGWRYLVNLFAPFWLSAVYFVDPVRGVQDSRILQYGLALGAVIGGSIWLAPNRKLAVFLWLWLIGALGPSLNLVAIPHFMQDRYIYLSTPAFFLLLWQATARLTPRPDARLSPLRVLAPAYVGLLVVLALQRSFVWDTAIDIFTDAVEKQPKAAYARFGLGMSYGQAAEMEARKPGGDKARVDSYRQQWMEHWRAAIDQCPDVTRFSFYSEMALNVGEDCNVRGDLECAEKYWRLAAWPPPGVPEQAPARSLAMGWLASLRLSRRQNEQAYEFAHEALGVYPAEETVLLHARAAMALAKDKQAAGDVKEAKRLREQARIALGLIPAWSKNAPIAAELLKSLPAPNQ